MNDGLQYSDAYKNAYVSISVTQIISTYGPVINPSFCLRKALLFSSNYRKYRALSDILVSKAWVIVCKTMKQRHSRLFYKKLNIP